MAIWMKKKQKLNYKIEEKDLIDRIEKKGKIKGKMIEIVYRFDKEKI